MGSPDPRQIDGLGGGHPLTSKVAIIGPASVEGADVDYLFLQVSVDKPEVSDAQGCGNILSGVGPWAIENGLVAAQNGVTEVRIHMLNTKAIAIAHVPTPNGIPEYEGQTSIDGVPGTAAPIALEFLDVAGSSCGSLLPTGAVLDEIDGVSVTCVDNGMPVVILDASDFGKTGTESPTDLERDAELKDRLEGMRIELGRRMNLGDVTAKTVPKMCLVSPPQSGGAINTRMFIPHRVHTSIGVFGAVSVATTCLLPKSVAARVARTTATPGTLHIDVEHPTGFLTIEVETDISNGGMPWRRVALLRTARKLMHGVVFVPSTLGRAT